MELQIQNLISSIQQDGIEKANQEAAAIVEEAKKQAASLLAEAKEEAGKIKEDAKKEVAVFQSNAQLSAEQAKRDAVLAFKQEIQAEFEKILAADVSKSLNERTMATLIKAALTGEDVSAYSAEVSEVTDTLKSELAEQVKGGLEIRPSRKVRAGFRLATKDGSGYFDCSDEEISKMLMPFFRDIHL